VNFSTEHQYDPHRYTDDGWDLGPEPPVADDLERASLDRYIDSLPEVFAAVDEFFRKVDAGEPLGPTMSPDEVRAWLDGMI
jgi:hypothetical protein